jgi:hypothetical protein
LVIWLFGYFFVVVEIGGEFMDMVLTYIFREMAMEEDDSGIGHGGVDFLCLASPSFSYHLVFA